MQRLKSLLIWFWRIASRPSAHLSLGFLALGGFVCGVLFWGAFNTALEITNTEKFCTSCHEMRNNVFEELQRTPWKLAAWVAPTVEVPTASVAPGTAPGEIGR